MIDLVNKNILITSANGFIGKNLYFRVIEMGCKNILQCTRSNDIIELAEMISKSEIIFHLAGENRPKSPEYFEKTNVGLTQKICETLQMSLFESPRKVQFVHISSAQHGQDNHYGRSKKKGEEVVEHMTSDCENCYTTVFRLPGVFGKWARPNYNSVVATFCYNIANNIPIQINEPERKLKFVHVDDVIDAFIDAVSSHKSQFCYKETALQYNVSLRDLAQKIWRFKKVRVTSILPSVGAGIDRALYSTYLSYLPVESFKYEIPSHRDVRGKFVEFLKTDNAGQFSFFTAEKGVTRGGHYHHVKNEKFLVIKGIARFRFRNLNTRQKIELVVSDKKMEIVDTPPGWVHDVTNIGDQTLVVMLWANEIFEPDKPDTIYSALE